MAYFEIYLSDAPALEPYRTKFRLDDRSDEIVSARGKLGGALGVSSSFQWTNAVQALVVLALKTAAGDTTIAPPLIEGLKGSLASSLDYALYKRPQWLQEMFGITASGRAIADMLFKRSNPGQKYSGPTSISLNTRVLAPQNVRIYLNEAPVQDPVVLRELAISIDGDERRTPRRQPLSPTLNGELRASILQKLCYDFEHSCLYSSRSLANSDRAALRNLELAGIAPRSSDRRLPHSYREVLGASSWNRTPSTSLGTCELSTEKLRVSCSAIYPAIVATLLHLKRTHLPLMEICSAHINSIDLTLRLNRREDYDFIFCAEDPFFLIGGPGTQRYQKMMSCHVAPQWLLTKPKAEAVPIQKICIVPRSSGEAQIMSGIGVTNSAKIEQFEFSKFGSLSSNLDQGSALCAWEPVASSLCKKHGLIPIPTSLYRIYVSLFALRSTWSASPAQRKRKSEFFNCFLEGWNYCASNRNECINLLLANTDFLHNYVIGSALLHTAA